MAIFSLLLRNASPEAESPQSIESLASLVLQEN
ncbi:hypothetical protein EDB95_2977 [Dinghuibacter silviterrae]|uniref:Uncharacterized protein n=1 Tax=Dinghuibacter silviterrae TaxID=1539049 RepID=A0A4R8DXI4_9BACT|nr:hypothetical protein EDB95_2977 [Dinghuibacter silviterrae]